MTLLSATTAAAVLASAGAAAIAKETHIECDLTGPKNQHYGYSFSFDHAKGTLLWIEGNRELKMERHTATELLVSYRGKFADTAANAAFFDLNLVSGGAAVVYFPDPTSTQVAQCEKQQSSGCNDSIVLSEYGETGNCTFEERGGE